LQDRGDQETIYSILNDSIGQAFGYYRYSFYLFDVSYDSFRPTYWIYALFGALVSQFISFVDPQFSILIREFYIQEFDLSAYTGQWTPANVFHSWRFVLYASGGYVLVAVGGFINGILPLLAYRFSGIICYLYVIYFITFSSFIQFPFQRANIFIGLFLIFYLEKYKRGEFND
jgi:hypothetical protein